MDPKQSFLCSLCCAVFVVHSLLCIRCCAVFVVHSLLCTLCCALFVVHSLLRTLCCALFCSIQAHRGPSHRGPSTHRGPRHRGPATTGHRILGRIQTQLLRTQVRTPKCKHCLGNTNQTSHRCGRCAQQHNITHHTIIKTK